jgi:DNA-binding GntR family transcriptional regulator
LRSIPDGFEGLAEISGALVARAEGKVRAVPAPPAAVSALSLAGGAMVLSFERLSFDTDDQPIEIVIAYLKLDDEYCAFDMR